LPIKLPQTPVINTFGNLFPSVFTSRLATTPKTVIVYVERPSAHEVD